ncbi:holin family protein [Roseovarius sp. SYSU LYC5161]|uniref:holin family protein n=1 Tax=Roseovarius halophilus (ex Wu et al. 2025) TaxID=3376060 RepID=UPI00399C2386
MVIDFLKMLFGGGRNAVADTAEVFRVNAEARDSRDVALRRDAMAQLAAEFARPPQGPYDRFIDAVNRVPRPAMALGTLALFVMAMRDPVWFGERMQGLLLVPEPLWWLLGAVVSFYFGARHQAKGHEFRRSLAAVMARAPEAVDNIAALRNLDALSPGVSDTGAAAKLTLDANRPGDNPALQEWRGQSR